LTKQSAAPRLALPHPFFADARFWGARLSDKPITVAFWRVAPSVRLSAFAILATGSLRAGLRRSLHMSVAMMGPE
jgi:hypothetical protein